MKRFVKKARYEPFPQGLEKRLPAGAGVGCGLEVEDRVLIQEYGKRVRLFHPIVEMKAGKKDTGYPQ